MTVRPAKTQIGLGIPPVGSEASLCTQGVAKDPSLLYMDNKDLDQTGHPDWANVQADLSLLGTHAILLVLS